MKSRIIIFLSVFGIVVSVPVFSQSAALRQQYRQAVETYWEEGGRAAFDDFQDILRQAPSFAEALAYRGSIYRIRGENDRAMADVNRSIELRPDLGIGYSMRSRVYLVLDDIQRAIDDSETAIRNDPSSRIVWSNYARALRAADDTDGQIEALERTVELNTDNYPSLIQTTYNRLGLGYKEQERYRDAEAAFRQAIDTGIESQYPYYNLGRLLRERERYSEAVRFLTRAIEIDPEHVWSIENRGLALRQLGRYEEAIEDFSRVIELNHNDSFTAAAYHNRGLTYFDVFNTERAVEDFLARYEMTGSHLDSAERRIRQFETGTPPEPILRPNTDGHFARANRIDVDRAGRIAVSASDDKTLKIWDVTDGSLIKTIRVPINYENDGLLYAAAISPDGQTVVTAGFTTYERDSKIFVIDVDSSEIVRVVELDENSFRLGDVGAVFDLEYSDDGRYLAVATGRGRDLVLSVPDYETIARLENDGDLSASVSWYGSNLVSAKAEGEVRVYRAPDFGMRYRWRPRRGMEPAAVAFHPSGRRIAVGFANHSGLQILDERLNPLYEAASPDSDVEDNYQAEWIDGGDTLITRFSPEDSAPDSDENIRVWSQGGRGRPQTVSLGASSPRDIKRLPQGGFLIATGAGELMRVNDDLSLVWHRQSVRMLFPGDDQSHFRVSNDGGTISFQPEDRPMMRFDIEDRRFTSVSTREITGMTAPREFSSSFRFENWDGEDSPILNGRPWNGLKTNENSLAVAIAPDSTRAAIGASYSLLEMASTFDQLVAIKIDHPGHSVSCQGAA